MKKSSAKIGKSQGLQFHPIVSIVTLVIGILGTLLVTHVLAQTANNTIYACVNNSTGIPRIVTSTTTCRTGETLLTWNIQGPQGVPGPSGSGGGSILCPGCLLGGNSPSFAGKDFTGADFNATQWGGGDLTKTNFSNAYMNGAAFAKGVIFDNTIFHNVTADTLSFLINVHGTSTDFSNIHGPSGFSAISFSTDASFPNCNFQGATVNLSFSYPGSGSNGPNFSGCDFSNADLSGNNQGTYSSFLNVDLSNANFTNTNLHYVTDMKSAMLTGATWNNTTCPDGSNSNSDGGTCINNL